MASIPLTFSGNNPSSIAVSIKADDDPLERFQTYSNTTATFEAISDGYNHSYTATISQGGCQASKRFDLICGSIAPAGISFSIGAVVNPGCNSGTLSNGSVQINSIVSADRYKLIRNNQYVNSTDCTSPDGYWSGGSATVSLPYPPPSTSYTYTIRAYNGPHCGDWFDQSVTVTSPACQPSVSTQPDFTLTADQPSCSNNQLGPAYLRIRNGINTTHYFVSQGSTYTGSVDCSQTGFSVTNGSGDFVIGTPPPSGQSQAYTVRGYNGANCGEWADHTVVVTSPVCTPPVSTQPDFSLSADNLVCSNNTVQPVSIHIRNGVNATRFFINTGSTYTGSDCNSGTSYPITNGSADYTLTDVPASGQSRIYTVRAYNGTDCSQWADHTISLTAPVCQATTPNPADDGCTIYFHLTGSSNTITDLYRLNPVTHAYSKFRTVSLAYAVDMALFGNNIYLLGIANDFSSLRIVTINPAAGTEVGLNYPNYTDSYAGLTTDNNGLLYAAGGEINRLNSNGTFTKLFNLTGGCQGDLIYSPARNSFFVTITKDNGTGYLTEYSKSNGAVLSEVLLPEPKSYGMFSTDNSLFVIMTGGNVYKLTGIGGSFVLQNYTLPVNVLGASQQPTCLTFS